MKQLLSVRQIRHPCSSSACTQQAKCFLQVQISQCIFTEKFVAVLQVGKQGGACCFQLSTCALYLPLTANPRNLMGQSMGARGLRKIKEQKRQSAAIRTVIPIGSQKDLQAHGASLDLKHLIKQLCIFLEQLQPPYHTQIRSVENAVLCCWQSKQL